MYDEFGKLLKQYREGQHLTQEQLAGKLERHIGKAPSKGTISKWEHGDRRPSEETVEALEEILFGEISTILLRAARYRVGLEPRQPPHSEIDFVTAQSRKEHFGHMADIAKALLSGNLSNVTTKSIKTGDKFDIFEYFFWEGGAGQGITGRQLSDMLERNIESLSEQPDDAYDLDCFLHHLVTEYPEVKSKGFNKFAEENPYELIDILRLLTRRKTFKGACPVCKDWW